ncbi:DNA repair protein RecN [Filifactor villosus]|uniref:DNA repair protein RecN n=1 Tax=Filifactor villosus TaxID=29374 RepID=A0ABV9QJM2_9FIRM
MLKEIYIKNFALIDELRIQLDKGLTVLTGETGSGKSIIIDALSLCFGRRADKDFIRHGQDKSIVEIGITSLSSKATELLEKLGISYEGNLIITRELHRDNSSIARVNGRMVPISALKSLALSLLTIHGQNEFESLTQSSKQLQIIDDYGKDEIEEAKRSYRGEYRGYVHLLGEMEKIQEHKDIAEIEREMDLLSYQIEEISQAKLREGELEELEAEKKLQTNAEKIYEKIREIYSLLYEGEMNILSSLDKVVESTQVLSGFDEIFADWNRSLTDTYYNVEDVCGQIRSKREDFVFDESRLEEIFLRLDVLKKLYRKYGGDYESTMLYKEEIEKRLLQYRQRDILLEEYMKKKEDILQRLEEKAGILHDLRIKVAGQLENLMIRELDSLNLKNTRFKIDFKQKDYSPDGQDEILFLISFNAGEELKPFHKVASGGEISRFMLALQNLISSTDEIQTLIFDEIDTGVSGVAAGKIAQKLVDISCEKQVICITHLPQIASFGDQHYLVEKEQREEEVRTLLSLMSEEERVLEIAKMTVGENISDISLRNARELLDKNKRRI